MHKPSLSLAMVICDYCLFVGAKVYAIRTISYFGVRASRPTRAEVTVSHKQVSP